MEDSGGQEGGTGHVADGGAQKGRMGPGGYWRRVAGKDGTQ